MTSKPLVDLCKVLIKTRELPNILSLTSWEWNMEGQEEMSDMWGTGYTGFMVWVNPRFFIGRQRLKEKWCVYSELQCCRLANISEHVSISFIEIGCTMHAVIMVEKNVFAVCVSFQGLIIPQVLSLISCETKASVMAWHLKPILK